MGRRKSPDEIAGEVQRMADGLYGSRGHLIRDQGSFQKEYMDYFQVDDIRSRLKDQGLMNKIFEKIRKKNPKILKEKTSVAKVKVKGETKIFVEPQAFINLWKSQQAGKDVNLADYTTSRSFKYLAKEKGKKVVYARPDQVKGRLVYRDRHGRFVRVVHDEE